MLRREQMHGYQRATVAHLVEQPRAGAFLGMGLGKTVSTLTAFDILQNETLEIRSALVISPKRVAQTVWDQETQEWEHLKHLTCSRVLGSQKKRINALHSPADLYLINRENVPWLCGYYGGTLPFDMIIIDESSSFKNHQSLRFKALKAAIKPSARVVLLTGTPSPRSLMDLWAQLFLLDQGERLEKFIGKFRKLYFTPGRTHGHVVYNYDPQKHAEKVIGDKIKDICISMKTRDYLDLPAVTENEVLIPMPDKVMREYSEFEKEKVLEIFSGVEDVEIAAINAAALLNKLIQFANGAVYDENKDWHKVHDLKLDALEEIVEGTGGEPLLVAWSFRSDRDRIMERFKHLDPQELDDSGEVQKAWNRGEVKMLIAHPASAGHGLNLQKGGHNVVWFGPTWSLELYQQFNARLDRKGQKLPVTIHRIIAKGTADEKIIKSLGSKDRAQEVLLAAVKDSVDKYRKFFVKK